MNEIEMQRALYPRVSDIIAKQTEREMRAIPIDNLVNAAIRGTKVHDYCTAWAKSLWIPEMEPICVPYIEAFDAWAANHIAKPLFSAVRLYDDSMRFSGEFDMIVELKTGKRALIDIKTSSTKSKSWPIQLAAYSHLCKLYGYEFDDVFILHLKKETKKKKEEETIEQSLPLAKAIELRYEDINSYWNIFSSALLCFDYFDRKEDK